MKRILILAGVLSALPGGRAEAFSLRTEYLHPTSHVSASGEYALFVDPSCLMGSGPADYRLARNGETVWTNRFPFSLWNAVVSDSGAVAGCAYSHGWEGYPLKDFDDRPGDFSVVVLSPAGALVAQDVHPRQSGGMDAPPVPVALDLFFDGLASNFVVRVDHTNQFRNGEQWWVYDLASGERRATLEPRTLMPDPDLSRTILAARPLPGLPLVLVHWWRYADFKCGGVFTLVDAAGQPVWTLSLSEDYEMPGREKWGNTLFNHVRQHGAVLGVSPAGTFDLYHVRAGQRVSYAVAQTESGQWIAGETARAPYPWTAPAAATNPPPATADLEKLGELPLAAAGGEASNAFAGVEAFDFDPGGTICALKDPRGQPRLLHLTQKGEIRTELRLPEDAPPDYPYAVGPAAVGNQRFVVGFPVTNNVTRWYLADFATNEIRRLAQVDDSCPDACAGFPDGRFVALTTRNFGGTRSHGITMFDATGKTLWVVADNAGYSDCDDELLSPEDVVFHGTNEIAVLDHVRKAIQFFDDRGRFRRIVDFEKVWDRKPNYLTDLAADADGGFLLYDFNAKETLLRLNGDGTIRRASSPRRADGSLFRVRDGVKRSPQGDLWTCDGQSLMRLDAQDRADLVLGPAADPAALADPGLAVVGPGDRVYVGDERTKSIHVFDAAGQPLGRCQPAPEDVKEISRVSHLAFAPDGRLFAALDFDAKDYLVFGADFARIGWSPTPPTARLFGEQRFFQPNGTNVWIAGMHDLLLFDAAGNLLRKISRRADGQWLERPGLATVAPNGSIAIRASSQDLGASINVFDANGNAVSSFDVPYHARYSDFCPFAPLAYDGQRIYARDGNQVAVHGLQGELRGVFAFAAAEEAKKWTGPFLAADGRELWFVVAETRTVHRFAVP
ncbi:MAG: hypothetical protein AB7V22_05240 [Kiritimatiellia bacterium]